MDENRNSFQTGNFQGQALCREVTRSHGGLFKIGTPAFCSESIGFLECTPKGPNIAWFAYSLSLSLSLSPSLPPSLSSLFCVGRLHVSNAHVWTYFLYKHPLSRPYNMTGLLPESLQYALVYCFPPFWRKISTLSSETILFHVMPLQNDRSLSNPYKMGCCSYASHASKGLAPDCAGYIYIIVFGSPPAMERWP